MTGRDVAATGGPLGRPLGRSLPGLRVGPRVRPRRRRFGIAALAVGLALLTGCSAVPGTGAVQVGLSDLEQADQPVLLNPSGPVTGASQEDVVRGFVLAAGASTDDYSVAREFLSPEYAKQWDPYSGVLVDSGRRSYDEVGEGAGVLSVDLIASVDAEGEMLPVESAPSTELRFELERVGGEWRISSAPSGVILDSTTFTTVWSSHQVYFVGADETLVPETRWFLTRSALATEIVGALLAGPGERMREVVTSGFPPGTALATSSVTVTDGRARVDFTSELLAAGSQALAEIRQQLSLSLQTVTGVSAVDVYVEGSRIEEQGDDVVVPRLPAETASIAVLQDDEFGVLAAGDLTPMGGFGRTLADYAPSAITLAPDEESAAVLSRKGVSRVDDESSVVVDARRRLLEPSVDPQGYVWSLSASDPGTFQISGPEGTVRGAAAPWLAGLDPVAARVAPDGARIAVLVDDEDGGSQVLVAGIVRDEDGQPLRTTDEADVELWLTGDPVDLDWAGQLRFVALSADGDASTVTLSGPGVFSTALGSVPGGVRVTGDGGRTQVRVLTDTGDLYASQGSAWQRVEEGIELLAKRG